MTTEHRPPDTIDYSGSRLDWAAGELRIASDAPPPQRAAAFLSRLREEDFLPPVTTTQAFDVLRAGRTQPADRPDPEAYLDHHEARLCDEITAFEQAYFSLATGARSARHAHLVAQSAGFPRCEARLESLARGLTIQVNRFGEEAPLLDQAAHWCSVLFLLPPKQRAARRQAILNETGQDSSKWQVAARALRQQAPDIVALAPELIDSLATRQDRLERQVRIERKVAANADRVVMAELVNQRPARDTSNNKTYGWVIFVVVMAAVKLFSAIDRHSSSPRPSAPHNYYRPPIETPLDVNSEGNRGGATDQILGRSNPYNASNELKRMLDAAADKPREPVKSPQSIPFDATTLPPAEQPAVPASEPPVASTPYVPTPPVRAPDDLLRNRARPGSAARESSSERMRKLQDEMQERSRKQREAADQRMQESRQRMERHRQEAQERMERMRSRAPGR